MGGGDGGGMSSSELVLPRIGVTSLIEVGRWARHGAHQAHAGALPEAGPPVAAMLNDERARVALLA